MKRLVNTSSRNYQENKSLIGMSLLIYLEYYSLIGAEKPLHVASNCIGKYVWNLVPLSSDKKF